MNHVITNLRDHFLVASSQLNGSAFERAVIYMCNHDESGAMGVMINQPLPSISFNDITESMGIEAMMKARFSAPPIIYNGGPVEKNRGFVIHSTDYKINNTIHVGDAVSLSATADIVNDIAKGHGPNHMNFCLGYAGWEAGQLEHELKDNSWFVVPASEDILFTLPTNQRYDSCTARLGLNNINFFDNSIGLA